MATYPTKQQIREYIWDLRETPDRRSANVMSTQLVLRPTHKAILMCLSDRYNVKLGYAYPKVQEIASAVGCSKRHVQHYMRHLVAAGVIRVVPCSFRRSSQDASNAYLFVPFLRQFREAWQEDPERYDYDRGSVVFGWRFFEDDPQADS